MSTAPRFFFPALQEPSFQYTPSPRRKLVYEISLKTPGSQDWLHTLPGVHRLVQTLLQGQLAGQYEILDFLIWPEGLFIRISLLETPTLSLFLKSLKEKSSPPGEPTSAYWDEELQWIRLIPPEKIADSTNAFLATVDQIRREIYETAGLSNNLFFFYRNAKLAE